MTKFGDSMRVTAGAFKQEEEIRLSAWQVWQAARNITVSRDADFVPHVDVPGRKGRRYRGSMTSLIRNHIAAAHLLQGEAWDNYYKALSRVWRAGGNAICISGQTRGQPVIWWIADEWSELIDHREPSHRDVLEARLSPQEAGEDRPASEVIIRHPKQKESPVSDNATNPEELVLAAVYEFPEPSTSSEVAGKTNLSQSAALRTLNRMVDTGVLFSRKETPDERAARAHGVRTSSRRSLLFWHAEPVITRTLPEFVEGTAPTHGTSGLQVAAIERAETRVKMLAEMDDLVLKLLKREGGYAENLAAFTKLLPRSSPFAGEQSVRDSFRRLADAGRVVIDARSGRPNRYSLPTIKQQPTREATVTTMPSASIPNDNLRINDDDKYSRSTILHIYNTAITMRQPVDSDEMAQATGFAPSTTGHVMKRHPELFTRVGTRNRHYLYQVIEQPVHAQVAARPEPAAPPVPPVEPPIGSYVTVDDGGDPAIRAIRDSLADVEAKLNPLMEQRRRLIAALELLSNT